MPQRVSKTLDGILRGIDLSQLGGTLGGYEEALDVFFDEAFLVCLYRGSFAR